MSETQKTAPTPIDELVSSPLRAGSTFIFDAHDRAIAHIAITTSDRLADDKAVAAEMVRRWNAHDELVKALSPFAAVAEHDIGDDETDADRFQPIRSEYNRAPKLTVGDLRRALAVLSSLKAGG